MSNQIRSILAVIDRTAAQAKPVAAKAVSLAHVTGGHLELFLCDAEAAFNRRSRATACW